MTTTRRIGGTHRRHRRPAWPVGGEGSGTPRRSRLGALAAVLLAACSGAEWRAVDQLLAAASDSVRRAGFAPLSGPYNDFGVFRGAFTQPWTVALDSGESYVVAAACTEGCESLRLAVDAPDGTPAARDTAPAGRASLVVVTARTGAGHTVRIAAQCAAGARCRWASQVYARGGRGLRPGFAGGER